MDKLKLIYLRDKLVELAIVLNTDALWENTEREEITALEGLLETIEKKVKFLDEAIKENY
jgi:hypothetical protein